MIGAPIEDIGGAPRIRLANAVLRFVEDADGRGPGLGGVDLTVRDTQRAFARAAERALTVERDAVQICGMRFRLAN